MVKIQWYKCSSISPGFFGDFQNYICLDGAGFDTIAEIDNGDDNNGNFFMKK